MQTTEDRDIELLKDLDAIVYTPDTTTVHTPLTLTPNSIDQILTMVRERSDLAFHPTISDSYNYPAFEVIAITNLFPGGFQTSRLLTISEAQLPPGYDFEKLSEVFLSKEKLGLRKHFGLPPIRKRSHYVY